jgi:aconitate hydratase
VWTREEGGETIAYPDTVVGTDSHTTMINGIGVLGWGVGGIEAEAAMLGQPVSMLIPEVIGFRLTGKMPEGATATDLVLTVTQMLRRRGVVGKFVEFFGPGLDVLSVEDRATIANMAPEYGATCGFFPVDQKTIDYLAATGRDPARVALVEAYCKAQGLWRSDIEPDFTDTLELSLADVRPSLAGPKRPQDRVLVGALADGFTKSMHEEFRKGEELRKRARVDGAAYDVGHGDVVIAAITSCTNTSNPSVLIAAGLLARNARAKGLKTKPWVKTSLAPGSQVVTDYLDAAGLSADLDALGFNLVGYGCTTCIGNSGPLPPAISATIADSDLVVASVLSGNRNFEGRVNQDVRANYLASPPLVVAYALAGSVTVNLETEPLGTGKDAKPVYLRDIWPSNADIEAVVRASVTREMFAARYSDVFKGDVNWQAIKVSGGRTYDWPISSTYVKNPPYFDGMSMNPAPIVDVNNAAILALFGDSITTDHISPAGNIKKASPAGKYLSEHQVAQDDFNSYGARRGNHEVMMRGTFANIRIKNAMVKDASGNSVEGGFTLHQPSGERMAIYDAAMRYQSEKRELIIFAGKEYGTGSSRDWAAKGTRLLGARAVIAESFERIHRSNLIGMGVLPLQFRDGDTWKGLGLTGAETISIGGVASLGPRQGVTLRIARPNGQNEEVDVLCRIDTENEVEYFRNGGILHYVLRGLATGA